MTTPQNTVEPQQAASDGGSASSPLAIVGWIIFVLLVIYGVLIGGAWAGIYLVSLRTVSLVLVALGLGAWFMVSLRNPRWRPGTAIWPTLVIPVATLALATLASPTPRLGLEYVAWAVLLVGLYLFLVRILATQTARDRIGALAAMLTLVIGLLYLGTVLLRWFEWWDLIGGFAFPPLRPLFAGLSLGAPGTVLGVQVLLATVAIAGLGFSGRRRQLLVVVLAVITALVVVVSASRAGWLALAGALVVVSGIWLIVAARRGSLRHRLAELWGSRNARLVLGAGVIGALAGLAILGPSILARVLGSGDGGRWQYFTVALRMFEDSPILGLGPGTWAVKRAAYTQTGELDWYIPHAHDIYLHTLAELGIVGLVAGFVALLPVAWLVFRALRSTAPDTRRWAWGALFILVFLGLVNIFDFHMNVPAELLVAAIPFALLDASSDRGIGLGGLRLGERAVRSVGTLARAALWLGCLCAILVLGWAESVAWTHAEAVRSSYAGDWEVARGPADEAVAADPAMSAYQVTRGLVASAQADWPVAAEAYAIAAEADDMPQSWLGLAQAQLGVGADPDEVATSIEQALRIGTQQSSVVYAAGHLYDRLGFSDRADAAYAAAIADFPSLAADPVWGRDASLRARFAGIVEQASAQAPTRAWEIALMAGDPERAHELTAAAGSTLGGLVVEAWQGDPEALEEIYRLADTGSGDANLLAWGTRLAARSGDDERADRYQRLALYVVTGGGRLPGTEIRVDEAGWFGAVPAGSLTGYAGHYLYRRPLVLDLLPPGLPRLVHADRDEIRAADRADAEPLQNAQ